jgi:hypothetical protein
VVTPAKFPAIRRQSDVRMSSRRVARLYSERTHGSIATLKPFHPVTFRPRGSGRPGEGGRVKLLPRSGARAIMLRLEEVLVLLNICSDTSIRYLRSGYFKAATVFRVLKRG